MQGQRQRERIRGVIGNAEEFTDRGDMAFAVYPAQPLRLVEDKIGLGLEHSTREIGRGLEPDDFAQGGERVRDGIDRLRLVPLGVEIGLGKLGPQNAARGNMIERGGGGIAGSLRRRQLWFQVVGEAYSNRQRISLMR